MEKLTNIWAELEKKKKLPSGPLTQSCQAELQELMRQLDIMLSSKKREWERDMESLQVKLDMRDQELRLNTSTLHLKNKENEDLHSQVMVMNKVQKEIVEEYEGQLIELRSEVHKMKKEYEKLQRKYAKQARETRRMKEDVLSEIGGSKTEITRLRDQLEEYHQRSKEWDQQKRITQKEIESLEAQKRALKEKCDFIQQSETCQSQLGRRRRLQGETESALNTKITQLEEQLERCTEIGSQQQGKITSLKKSLSEALSAHKQAMTDNEVLLEDVRKLTHRLRVAENEKCTLGSELESREHLLRTAQEDCQQCYHRLTSAEQTLAAKDNIIRSLGDSNKEEVSEKVTSLQQSLQEAASQIRDLRRREKQLKDEVSVLENKFKMATTRTADVTNQLQEKDDELHHIKNTQVNQLTLDIQKLVDKLSTLEDTHQAQTDGMKVKLSELTTELHRRDSMVVTLSEKSSRIETQVREISSQLDNKLAELKVATAQIESLRVENRHLRHDVMEKLGNVFDRVEAEHRLQMINDDYLDRITRLQKENRELREDIVRLHQEMAAKEHGFHDELQATTTNSTLTIQGLKANDQRERDRAEIATDHRFGTMQDYMDSTVRRHRDQIDVLESQRNRLQDELQMEKQENTRLTDLVQEKSADTTGQSEDSVSGTNLESEPMSLLHSLDDLDSPSLSVNVSFNSSTAEAAAERFLTGERERLKELETLIDSRIEDMKTTMDNTIKKYHR
ncbi:centrosomal protein of 63 kDa-like isoform X3 [Gigantopelta aegis]|uniref:centrosomal protein of 63 kDa-like isoform X3 n=1 Tax=Gigantopelta aegis TaxID=1735272 RepID=UPI001B888505|nr:centrosomal protein of 63 kDa-like isoform X3 [Gigantopelta aegis]